jgi:hypothetical protein
MKRATQKQLWFAIGVIALLVAAWWQWHSDRLAAPGTLLTLKPEAITHVDLQIGDKTAEHYVKHDGHWWYAGQINPAPADDMRLGELVRIAAAPVANWVPASTYDPGKIGLAPPQARLDLDGQTLLFGGMTAIGQNGYVQVGDRVGIVSLRYMPRSAQSQTLRAE